jgi:hypothetical protein
LNRLIFFAILVGFFLVDTGDCWARVDIEPRLTLREEYNDNLFLDADNEESDYVTTVFPGVKLLFDSKYLNLDLDYGLNFQFYKRNPDYDETEPGDTQRARAQADILPGRDFTVMILEEISRVTIDERRQVVEENTIINKTDLNRFVVNPLYRFRSMPTFDAALGYRFEKLTYDSPDADDSDNHAFTVDLSKDLSPDLGVFIGYAQHLYESRANEDYEKQDLTGGFSWQGGPRLVLEGTAGVAWLDYEERGKEDPSVVWKVRADYGASEGLSFGLEYAEDFSVSVNEGTYKSKAARGNMRYQGKVTADFSVFAKEDSYRTEDREDRSAGAALICSVPLGKRVNMRFRGNYARLEFLPEEEDVRRYGLGGSVEYAMKVVAFSLGYTYNVNDSDFEQNDYRNNIGYLEAAFRF